MVKKGKTDLLRKTTIYQSNRALHSICQKDLLKTERATAVEQTREMLLKGGINHGTSV